MLLKVKIKRERPQAVSALKHSPVLQSYCEGKYCPGLYIKTSAQFSLPSSLETREGQPWQVQQLLLDEFLFTAVAFSLPA